MVNYNRQVELWELISERFKGTVEVVKRQAREQALREGGDAEFAVRAATLRMESAEEKAKLWVVRVSLLLVAFPSCITPHRYSYLICIVIALGWASVERWFGGAVT